MPGTVSSASHSSSRLLSGGARIQMWLLEGPNPRACCYRHSLPLARPVGDGAQPGCPPPARGRPRLQSHPVSPWAGLILTCLSSSKGRPESLGQAPERHGLGWVSGKLWQAPGSGFLGPQVGSWEWWGLRAPTCSLVKSLCQGLVFHLHQSTLNTLPTSSAASLLLHKHIHTHTRSLTRCFHESFPSCSKGWGG